MNARRRREFLKSTALVGLGMAGGIGAGPALGWLTGRRAVADDADVQPEDRLRELKIELPATTKPVATYVPAVIVGDMLYVSGHIPRRADGSPIAGKVGPNLTIEEAIAAARTVGLAVLATVRQELGSLNAVKRLVKTLGMVNCPPEFSEQPKVINGFSDLMVEVFGPTRGKGARSAVGMGSLPLAAVVEIEAIFQIHPRSSTN